MINGVNNTTLFGDNAYTGSNTNLENAQLRTYAKEYNRAHNTERKVVSASSVTNVTTTVPSASKSTNAQNYAMSRINILVGSDGNVTTLGSNGGQMSAAGSKKGLYAASGQWL